MLCRELSQFRFALYKNVSAIALQSEIKIAFHKVDDKDLIDMMSRLGLPSELLKESTTNYYVTDPLKIFATKNGACFLHLLNEILERFVELLVHDGYV